MTITSRIQLICYNLLEEGTVSTGTLVSGYPKERLFDRSLGFYSVASASGAFTVQVDQGSLGLSVDTLIVEGHNFNGQTLTWSHSENGSSWTTALTWSQSGNTQIVKQLTTALTKRYWKLVVGGGTFQATEILIGRALSFPIVWSQTPRLGDADDIQWLRTYGGVDHSIRIGPKRKISTYPIFMDRVQFPVSQFEADVEYLDDYVKPFFLIDHEGNCILAKFEGGPPMGSHMNEGLQIKDFSFREIPA